MLTNEQKSEIIHKSARACGLDGHIVVADKQSNLYTYAEKFMGKMSHYKNPHKNSYLYCDSVDACFFIERDIANVTFTARWYAGSKDLNISHMEKTVITINKMLETMQCEINEILGVKTDE